MKCKKLFAGLLAGVMLFGASMAMAENDAEWRAQKTPAQGCYVEKMDQAAFDALTETTIIKDPDSITGYTVTFRHYAPDATRVRIRGEWSLYQRVKDSLFLSECADPENWVDGMFPVQADMKDWPAYDMVKNEETGVWSYTIPLPSGTWSYRFYENGAQGAELTDYTDAVATTDVNNRPWEKELGEQGNSQVRVPFDGEKQTLDLSVQLPQAEGKVGTVEVVTYTVEGIETKDDPAVAVYLPNGYDAQRAEAYKVIYVSHGGGKESETSWYNKGSLANITDNLIAEGKMEPAVVVVLNNFAVNFDVESFMNTVIPMIEEKYNVATEPAGKALCGLSRGGMFTTEVMMTYPEAFGSYGLFSGSFGDPKKVATYPDTLANADLIYMSAGYYDQAHDDLANAANLLKNQGIEIVEKYYNGGHDWNVWRQQYADFAGNYLWK